MRTPRSYPETIPSAESGRPMRRGEKLLKMTVDGIDFEYRQPGWWCSLDDPEDLEGQLVDEDNLVADMAERTAKALAAGAEFPPALIRAIRLNCGLSQRDAGEVFGTGEKAFGKYEAGEIEPSNPTKRLLRLAMQHPELFRKPKRGALRLPEPTDAALIRKTLSQARMDRIYGPLLKDRPKAAG